MVVIIVMRMNNLQERMGERDPQFIYSSLHCENDEIVNRFIVINIDIHITPFTPFARIPIVRCKNSFHSYSSAADDCGDGLNGKLRRTLCSDALFFSPIIAHFR